MSCLPVIETGNELSKRKAPKPSRAMYVAGSSPLKALCTTATACNQYQCGYHYCSRSPFNGLKKIR